MNVLDELIAEAQQDKAVIDAQIQQKLEAMQRLQDEMNATATDIVYLRGQSQQAQAYILRMQDKQLAEDAPPQANITDD